MITTLPITTLIPYNTISTISTNTSPLTLSYTSYQDNNLNTDLIIQHVSNLSLIGNRINEVISSVIKCTSPAGIAVVGSSKIAIANIAMKDCGSALNISVLKNQFSKNKCRLSLLVLNSLEVKCNCFYSKSHYNPSGVRFMNGLGNTWPENVDSTYLSVWNDE